MSGTPYFSHRTLLSWTEEMTWRRWAVSFPLPSFFSELNLERNKQQLLSEQTHKRTNTFECISRRFWNCRWIFGKIVFLTISPYSSLWMDWKKILEQKRVSKPVKEERNLFWQFWGSWSNWYSSGKFYFLFLGTISRIRSGKPMIWVNPLIPVDGCVWW